MRLLALRTRRRPPDAVTGFVAAPAVPDSR